MTYYAYWRANNNIEPTNAISSTNKQQLIRDVIAIANVNRHPCKTCQWLVWDAYGIITDAGYTTTLGTKRRYRGSELNDIAFEFGLKSK